MSLMYENVVKVISKLPNERHDEDIEILLPWFRKKSDLFRNEKSDIIKDILRECRFINREENDVIIKQGERGDCFYIILRGSVSVYINTQLAEQDDDSDTPIHGDHGILNPGDNGQVPESSAQDPGEVGTHPPDTSRESTIRYELHHQNSIDFIPEMIRSTKAMEKAAYGHIVSTLGAGKSFGELALISKDCIRNASIIASAETVDLLVVHRTLYNRCLKQAQLQEFQEKQGFVNKSPLFSNWQPKHRKHMAMSLEKQNYEYEAHINKQGDPVVGIHFINKGQARLYTDASLHPAQFPNLNPFEDNETRTIQKHITRKNNPTSNDTNKESGDEEKQVGCGVTVIQRRREGYVAAEHRVHNRQTELCYIGPQEAIDDTEVAMDLPTYAHSARCTQDTEVFFLNLKNYERLVVKRNNRTVQLLKDSIETKLKCRLSRLTDFQVPLLRYLYFKLKSRDMPTTIKNEVEEPEDYLSKFDPPRGPMVDQFGPGSVFYRIRMRDQRRRYRDAINKGLAPKFAGLNLAKKPIMDNHMHRDHHPEMYTNSSINGSKQDVTKLETGAYLSKSSPAEYDMRRVHEEETSKDVRGHPSDTALASLEERIKVWLLQADGKEPKAVPKLRRFYLQEASPKLRPGARVLFDKAGKEQATIYATLSDDDEAYEPKQPRNLKRIALSNKYKSLSDGQLSSNSD